MAIRKNSFAIGIFTESSGYGGKEVDFILEKNAPSPCLAIEVKSQSSPKLEDVKSLLSFKELFPKSTTLVICQTPRAYSKSMLLKQMQNSTREFDFCKELLWCMLEGLRK